MIGDLNMKGIIDRFEGDIVIIEVDGETKDYKKEDVDPEADVNDVVEFIDGKWIVNKESTTKRTEEIKKLMDDVWDD